MKELLRLEMENAMLKKKIRGLQREKAELERDLKFAYDYINRRLEEAVRDELPLAETIHRHNVGSKT